MEVLHKKIVKFFAWFFYLLFVLSLFGFVTSVMLYQGRYTDEKNRISDIENGIYVFEDLGIHSFEPIEIKSKKVTRNAGGSGMTKEVTVYSLRYRNTGEAEIGYTKDYDRSFYRAERALGNGEVLTFRVLKELTMTETGDWSGTFSHHYIDTKHSIADYVEEQKSNLQLLEAFMIGSLVLPPILASISMKINKIDKKRKQI